MNRDGRGKPGRIVLKNQPRLRLADVLRRRRSTLTILTGELGLTTYAGLSIWCRRMGVVGPTEAEFALAFPSASRVNSPQEGVVVLEAPVVIAESSGSPIELPEVAVEATEPLPEVTETSQKKRRRLKDDNHHPIDESS